ncbi:MAG: DegT/DnrJ/EryC1/StrS family aminotransferase [Clostridia bacterium]|nr:DegT/DnrJ/EryC1/StrS family aminotransferase [Clostridia bacterium]
MNIPFSPPDIGEEEIKEVTEALRSGWITTGPKTKEFEKEIANFCHTEKAVCLNSATAALELTLRVLGIGEGDEVITSSYTYTASASPIAHVGAKIVLVDVKKDSWEMDYEQLANSITEKTKAIIPADIAGILCDYNKIFKIVEEKKDLFQASNEIQKIYNRIVVVADCAHGFGAQQNGKLAGELADFTTFSFHAVKNLTTAEGGAATWKKKEGLDNEEIYHQYQLLSLHGQTKDALHKNGLGAWEYDIVAPYYKCNMTDIMAGIGLAQMKRYPDLLKRRQEIIVKYNKAFADLPIDLLNHHDENHTSSGHLYFTRIKGITEQQRNEIIIKMAEQGIACNVHYKPLPMLTAYKNLGFDINHYPNAYDFYHNEITLPLYTKLTDEQIDYIIENFKNIVREFI